MTEVKNYLLGLQSNIINEIESIDGAPFLIDEWSKDTGIKGSGRTCILENGNIFESAGIGFSHVTGRDMPITATQHRPDLAGKNFEAMGVSLVFHPRNPYIPTVHMNVRYFQAGDVWWFGGGMDLTPYYGDVDDCKHFHTVCKEAVGADLYPKFKSWCDDYFYIKHRNEPRGIGGVFYDDFNSLGFNQSFLMTKSVGDSFLKAYTPIVKKQMNKIYTEKQREFQSFRRGRYVEFNLVYDRGTLFGLQSGGRADSILMSMPPKVSWGYQWAAQPNTVESRLIEDFLTPREWV